MIIAGIDVETTGVEGDDIEVVEVGYAIYDVQHKLLISSCSEIFRVNKWSEEAAEVHGIPQWVSNIALDYANDIDITSRIMRYDPAAIVAHNAAHDWKYVTQAWPGLGKLPWICTQNDLPHENKIRRVTSRKLMHLAVDYGLIITEWHRAVADAEVTCKIAAEHDLKKILEDMDKPKVRMITKGSFVPNAADIMKQINYKWDRDNKIWWCDNVSEDKVDTVKKIIKKVAPGWSINTMDSPPRGY